MRFEKASAEIGLIAAFMTSLAEEEEVQCKDAACGVNRLAPSNPQPTRVARCPPTIEN